VASFQIEAISNALRRLVLNAIEPGLVTQKTLQNLRDVFVAGASTTSVKQISEVTEEMSTEDLLINAEILRVSMIVFLTPEEAEGQRGYFGYRIPDESIAGYLQRCRVHANVMQNRNYLHEVVAIGLELPVALQTR
jgi:hypothetical protein